MASSDLLAHIKRHLAGRQRISLSHLAHACGLTHREALASLKAALQAPPMAQWLRKRGWELTDSRALGLPALERWPYFIPYLVRNAP
jgi:hypothetical protein